MRRLARRRPATFKSPRLFSMCALLVCLFIMMNSLRSFREPGPLAPRILSNLDPSLKQVNQSANESAEPPQSEDQQSDEQQADNQKEDDPKTDSQPTETPNSPAESSEEEPASAGADQSNVDAAANLNLREDLFLQDQLGLVQDGALKLQKLEMPSYWQILKVVKNASFEALEKPADAKVRFNELYSSAAKNRARLITMNVNIRRVTRYDTEVNPAGVNELYEVWGWSDTSKAWLYVFVTPELPPGLDANSPVNQSAKFAGYFYKLQGYHPGAAKPDAKPQIAPLLIGKFELAKPKPQAVGIEASPVEWILGSLIVIVGLIVILLRLFVFSVKSPKLARRSPTQTFDDFPKTFVQNPRSRDGN